MTRALNAEEVAALVLGDPVARIWSIGHIETGAVKRITPTLVLVKWPTEGTALIRYSRETGRRTDCHGEVLRAVPTATVASVPTAPDYLQF